MRATKPAVKRDKGDKGDKPLTHDPKRLLRRRLEAGLSIRELAARAQLGIGSISDLENGNQSARVDTLVALARALDCEVRDLLPDEPNGAVA